ncbi:hypothetical protein BD770DRAFT_413015 [Pilaira anomala]|nr:hypothetical protein BD770DRAFT_413015 [Pilaira anomala]
MEDNSNIPITVSEIPPRRSLFLAGLRRQIRSKDKDSPHQSKSTASSPTKSFTQTPLETWIDRSSSQRSDSYEDSLPPWATPYKNSQHNHPCSKEESPSEVEKDEFNDSTLVVAENNKVDREIQTEEFSILSTEEIIYLPPDNPEDESEPYCTPHPYSSPEENLQESSIDRSWSFLPINKNAGRDENNDTDSQATVLYDYNNETPESQSPSLNASLGIIIDSQATEPYDYKSSLEISIASQTTEPYNYDDPPDTQSLDEAHSSMPYNQYQYSSPSRYQEYDTPTAELHYPENSPHSNDLNHDDFQTPASYTPSELLNHYSPANSSNTYQSPLNDAYSPPITSPTQSAKLIESHCNPNITRRSNSPQIQRQASTSFGKDLIRAASIYSSDYERGVSRSLSPNPEENINYYSQISPPSTNRKQKLRERSTERHVDPGSPIKQQKLNIGSFGSTATEDDNLSSFGDSVKSQEAKQKMKKAMPIENYLWNTTSQEESLSDIGRVSTTPSFLTNNEDIKKEVAKSSITRSRRTRHGLPSKHISQ